MVGLHAALAWCAVIVNFVVGVWGLVHARQLRVALAQGRTLGAWSLFLFREMLALSQILVLVVGVVGLALLGGGHKLPDRLHGSVYGPFMVIAIVAAYGFRRPGDAAYNSRVFAVCCLVVAALGARAMLTGYHG